jgi:uncharacterized protein YyaL (SSP411 family)
MFDKPNRLANEVSPYLLQHSFNPVNWYPWGNEAFEVAKRENKLVVISIGYSSCHWCHIMEKESFTDEQVARLMNEKYVSIKVDREERPDIDHIYMSAVQIITRRGGWPLNCIALPDGRPVYGGTYFPKDQWLNILESMDATWKSEPERVYEVAEDLAEGIANTEIIHVKTMLAELDFTGIVKGNLQSIEPALDYGLGGTRGAPKFPMPGLLGYLMQSAQATGNLKLKNFVSTTLDNIANGGVYDHVGGGFFRYAVDSRWHTPHFEKMLYDNAQLVELYSLAYRINPNPSYRNIVYSTVDFLDKELHSPEGGFYCSLDADANGLEGGYYTWTKQELDEALEYDSEIFCSAYGVTPSGDINGRNGLKRCASDDQLSSLFDIPPQEIQFRLQRCLKTLVHLRDKRIPPLIDDKILVSWNGLLISALVQAFVTFKNQRFMELAYETASYLETKHFVEGNLKRVYCKGKTYGNALLDDYANYIRALITLYQVTLEDKWLIKAKSLVQVALQNFWDDEKGMFFYTPGSSELMVRKMELIDGVIPSSTSTMTGNLLFLAMKFDDQPFNQMAMQVLANLAENVKNNGVFVYGWGSLMLSQALPKISITIFDGVPDDVNNILGKVIYPNIHFELSTKKVKHKFQLCVGNTCKLPMDSAADVVRAVNGISLQNNSSNF